MASLISKELRWFFEGPAPSGAWEWFDRLPGDHGTLAYPRQDIYLVVSGRDDLGLKLREGRLEIKVRGRPGTGVSLLDGKVRGLSEDWEKSKWDYRDRIGEVQTPFESGVRVRVVKSRTQPKYRIKGKKLIPVPMTERPDQAFVAELTELFSEAVEGKNDRSAASRGWTMACEAIAARDKVDDAFALGASEILDTYEGPPLRQENSFGYPSYAFKVAELAAGA